MNIMINSFVYDRSVHELRDKLIIIKPLVGRTWTVHLPSYELFPV